MENRLRHLVHEADVGAILHWAISCEEIHCFAEAFRLEVAEYLFRFVPGGLHGEITGPIYGRLRGLVEAGSVGGVHTRGETKPQNKLLAKSYRMR